MTNPSPPPPSTGTIKATAVPGTLPDTAPFVWDTDDTAEERAGVNADEEGFEDDPPSATPSSPEIPAELDRILSALGPWVENSTRYGAACAALTSLYNRQREEIERLKAEQLELKREAILAFYNGASATTRRYVTDPVNADHEVSKLNDACERALRRLSSGDSE